MKLWKILGVELYEVGDLYLTMNNKNPGLRFKGTWELIAQGRTLVGVDSSDTPLNASNKTGGSTNPLSQHTHTQNAHYHNVVYKNGKGISLDGGSNNYKISWGSTGAPNGNIITDSVSATNQNAGNNTNHANWQPYLTTYIWQRVS